MKYNIFKKIFFVKVLFLLISLIIFSFLYIFSKYINEVDGTKSIVYIIDISNSMNINDVEGRYGVMVTRLDKVKQNIFKISSKYFDKGYKNGIIIFKKDVFYYLPPTLDKDSFDMFLSGLTVNYLKKEGKNINHAIELFANYTSSGSIGYVFSDFYGISDINLNIDLNRYNKKLYFVCIKNKIDGCLNIDDVDVKGFDKISFIVKKYNGIFQDIASVLSILGL